MRSVWLWRGVLIGLVLLLLEGCRPANELSMLPESTMPPAATAVMTSSPEEDEVTPTARPVVVPSVTPGTTPCAYRRVAIPEAGLVIDVPEGWDREGSGWVWSSGSRKHGFVGIRWATLQPPQEPEMILLPSESQAQVLASVPISTPLGIGRRIDLRVYAEGQAGDEEAPVASMQTHVLVARVRGDVHLAYDFFVGASSGERLAELESILEHVVASVAVSETSEGLQSRISAWVARELEVAPGQVEVLSLSTVAWPDTCLGIHIGENPCTKMEVLGQRGKVRVGDRDYEVRTDAAMTWVVLLPDAVVRAEAALAQELGVPNSDVYVLGFEAVTWRDACLGVHQPGQACLQVITPGYRIMFGVMDRSYEVHTDLHGTAVVIVQSLLPH